MKETILPVFFDTDSSRATPYREVLKGIHSAAVKTSVRIQTISEKDLEEAAWRDTDAPAIIASDSIAFVRRVIHLLREEGRRSVLAGLDGEQFGPDISCAAPSRRTETQQMVNYLYSLGCSKIALVGFGIHSINDTFRYHAAMSAVSSLGMDTDEKDAWLWESDPRSALVSFVENAKRYRAAICPNDNMAIQLVRQCKKSGISVPRDLWVCSFGNKIIGRYYSPSITTMTMDMPRVGEHSFYAWQFLCRQPEDSGCSVRLIVPGRLIVRESTAGLEPEARPEIPLPVTENDPFYSDPFVRPLAELENCLAACDELDLKILSLLMENKSYEAIVEKLFISEGALKYRLNKIYNSMGVKGRTECVRQLRDQLDSENPFRAILTAEYRED